MQDRPFSSNADSAIHGPTPEQMTAAIMRGTIFIVIAVDTKGVVTFFNAAAEKALGYRADDVVGRQSLALWHDPEEMHQNRRELSIKTGVDFGSDVDAFLQKSRLFGGDEKEWTYIRKDGSRFPGLLSIEAFYDKSGEAIGFLGIIKDITMRKQQQRVLKDQAAFFDTVIRNIIEGMVTIDSRGIVRSYNPSCQALFGYTTEEVVGQNISMLMSAPDSEDHDAHMARYLKTGEQKIIGIGREVMARRKDGSVFPIELSVSTFEADGEIMFSGLMRDVSERKRVAQEREQMIARLTESNAEFERFAYVASHDMQEPLRAMNSFSSLVMTEYAPALDEKGKLYLRLVCDAASRMQALVLDLLEYARLGKETARSEPFDAQEEFNHVLEDMVAVLGDGVVGVACDALPHIKGNPVQFSRLLQNLISNGLKYHRAGVAPKVHVCVQDKGDSWLFSIADNGIGIAEKNLEKIFEPFRRLHTRQEYAGTGLGLSVCRKIVENHSGKIWCESVLGQGSTFFFSWPK